MNCFNRLLELEAETKRLSACVVALIAWIEDHTDEDHSHLFEMLKPVELDEHGKGGRCDQ